MYGIYPVIIVYRYDENAHLSIAFTIGTETTSDITTIIEVATIYSPPISPFLKPRILVIEIDCAFFSIICLDNRYIRSTNIIIPKYFSMYIISPIETFIWLDTFVRSSYVIVDAIYLSSISVSFLSVKYPVK